MIVEDSAPVRERLVGLLQEEAGVEIVGEAEDEARALALYDEHKPDAAVVDIRIRNGSGIAVLDHIKRHNRHCTVIMLTNCAHIEFRQRCLDAGANHFLEKSREFSRVANVLRQLLRQRSGAVE
ncbi:MAG: response regulator transcription factor [Verrucomicrobiota bacterium]